MTSPLFVRTIFIIVEPVLDGLGLAPVLAHAGEIHGQSGLQRGDVFNVIGVLVVIAIVARLMMRGRVVRPASDRDDERGHLAGGDIPKPGADR